VQYIDEEGVAVTVYTVNERQGGLFWALRQARNDLSTARHAIISLFLRDFRIQFRQKLLGYLWALLTPLMGILSFIFLYFAGILKPGVEGIPYPVYLLVGTSLWGCLIGTVSTVSGGLQAQTDLIMRTNIPKLALAVSSLANIVYNMLVGMGTMGLVFFIYDFTPSFWFLVYPLLALPLMVLGTSIGLVLSVVGAIAKDMTQLVVQVLSIAMYATPIIYVTAQVENPLLRKLITFNPLTYMIDVPRAVVCLGQSEHIQTYAWISLGTLALSLLALRVFYLIHDLVAERL